MLGDTRCSMGIAITSVGNKFGVGGGLFCPNACALFRFDLDQQANNRNPKLNPKTLTLNTALNLNPGQSTWD